MANLNHLQTLSQISEQLNSVKAIQPLLVEVMDIIMSHLNAERGFIICHHNGIFKTEVSRNISQDNINGLTEISNSIVRQVFDSCEPILTIDAVEDSRFVGAESIALHGIRSVICIPLYLKDNKIGVIYLDSRVNRGRFNQESLSFLEAVSHQAAIAIENAQLYQKLQAENDHLSKEIGQLTHIDHMIGTCNQMKAVFDLIKKVAQTDSSVLIEGESGTGKELVARAIHYNSLRKSKPFIAQFCGALPENLLEGELFGYKKGAFTGAQADRMGLFESASNGSFFLDEISEINLNLQTKLLRVLQEREIWRIGENKPRPINTRIITATNKPLKDEVAASRFRSDLYFRLNVITIQLPPLRQRGQDITHLATHFLHHFSTKTSKKFKGYADSALSVLHSYQWPGNVRELQNTIERAVILSNSDIIEPEDLRLDNEHTAARPDMTLKEYETKLLIDTLRRCNGNRTQTAKKLDVSLRWVQMRLKEYRDMTGDRSL